MKLVSAVLGLVLLLVASYIAQTRPTVTYHSGGQTTEVQCSSIAQGGFSGTAGSANSDFLALCAQPRQNRQTHVLVLTILGTGALVVAATRRSGYAGGRDGRPSEAGREGSE